MQKVSYLLLLLLLPESQAESREAVACIGADPGVAAAAAPKARTRPAASERIGGHAAPKASYQQSSTRA